MIEHADRGPRNKDEIAEAVAVDIPDGSYVNLGIGQPTTVADYLTAESAVVLHTENGMLNMGRAAVGDEIDLDLINAGKVPVIELPGAAYFHHADSFAMMRGGHLDVCVLGAFQVSQDGDLRGELEELAVGTDVPQLDQGVQEATGRGAAHAGDDGDLAQTHPWSVGAEGGDHLQAPGQRLDELFGHGGVA